MTVLRLSCVVFCKNLRICDLRITHENLRICGLAHLRNLRICYCIMSLRICGFAVCGLLNKACLPTSCPRGTSALL
jgi:hypothetical protein